MFGYFCTKQKLAALLTKSVTATVRWCLVLATLFTIGQSTHPPEKIWQKQTNITKNSTDMLPNHEKLKKLDNCCAMELKTERTPKKEK